MVRLAKASSSWMEDDSFELAVRGSYLKQFGFDIGTRVVIEVTDGLIRLSLLMLKMIRALFCPLSYSL